MKNIRLSSASFLSALGLVLAVALTSCATTYVKPSGTQNPPPSEPFSAFQHFEVKPISMGAPYAGQDANEKARKKIQENFDERINPLLATWNAKAGADTSGRTLVIEPYIQDIKFINATARVWTGAMSGSSAVVLKVNFSDKTTGKVITNAEFYQRAAAMGGAFSFGSTDNNMLVRITEITETYFKANYDNAVGGPTGLPEEK